MNRTVSYVLPFVVFIFFLAAQSRLPATPSWWQAAWIVTVSAVLWIFSRKVIDWTPVRLFPTILAGAAVFVVWVAPDLLVPGWRSHWLFQNALTGKLESSAPPELAASSLFLGLRFVRAVVIVPIVEELFWRGWLMRWLIAPDFEKVALGSYAPPAFWITAVLFALEHGPYWEVGLAAGIAYNWWMVRTRSLADCIIAHAVTNAILSAYVIRAGKWEYWM